MLTGISAADHLSTQPQIAPCVEDVALIGFGQFKDGYWERYECWIAVDDYIPVDYSDPYQPEATEEPGRSANISHEPQPTPTSAAVAPATDTVTVPPDIAPTPVGPIGAPGD